MTPLPLDGVARSPWPIICRVALFQEVRLVSRCQMRPWLTDSDSYDTTDSSGMLRPGLRLLRLPAACLQRLLPVQRSGRMRGWRFSDYNIIPSHSRSSRQTAFCKPSARPAVGTGCPTRPSTAFCRLPCWQDAWPRAAAPACKPRVKLFRRCLRLR